VPLLSLEPDPLNADAAITKIIYDRIRPLMGFGHFMEG
jgi:hypothetical protein